MSPEEASERTARLCPGLQVTGRPQPLTGGHLNQVWRVPANPRSVVAKHAPPYVASSPELPLDPSRARFEARALSELGPGGALSSLTTALIGVPALLAFDEAGSFLVLEDLGSLPSLGEALGKADYPEHAPEALGRFIGTLHARTHGDDRLGARFDNQPVQKTRYEVQYRQVENFLARAEVRHAQALGQRADLLGRRLQQVAGTCLVMGDLWPPSVLVVGPGLRLIDWELSHFGNPAQDVAHLAAHLWMLAHRASSPTARARAERALPQFLEAYVQGLGDRCQALVSEALDDDCRVHFASEILMRTIGPFQRGYLYEGLAPTDAPIREAVEVAVDHLGSPTGAIFGPLRIR